MRKKKRKAPDVTRPLRRSVYLPPDLARAVAAQAKHEERRPSDMIRILIQRGLRATRETPPVATA